MAIDLRSLAPDRVLRDPIRRRPLPFLRRLTVDSLVLSEVLAFLEQCLRQDALHLLMVKASQRVGHLLTHPLQSHLVYHSCPLRPIFAVFTENHLCMGAFPHLRRLRCRIVVVPLFFLSRCCSVLQVDGVPFAGGGGPGRHKLRLRLSLRVRLEGVGAVRWVAGGGHADGGAETVL